MNEAAYREKARLFSYGHILAQGGRVKVFKSPLLQAESGIKHGFSSRIGGVSTGCFSELNLSLTRDEPDKKAPDNFRILCASEGLSHESLAVVNYEHGDVVLPVTASDAGRGFEKAPFAPCDGIVTNERDITLVTLHADCSAYFLYDRRKKVVGLCHAGWKGTLARIGQNAVELMHSRYGCEPGDILAAVGPCISQRNFEVDESLGLRFLAEFGCESLCREGKPGKLMLDIEAAAAISFLDAGISPENISLMNVCTYGTPELLYSYRRDNANSGAMAAYICLI